MEKIEGVKSNTFVYKDENNYVYYLNRVRNNNCYYVCANELCSAKKIVRVTNNVLLETSPHIHEPDLLQIEIFKFKEALRTMCGTTQLGLGDIFITCEMRYPDGARACGSFRNLKSMMQRARRALAPPVPKTLQELHDLLSDDR